MYLYTYMYMYRYICVHIRVCMYISMYLSIYLSVYLSIHLSIYTTYIQRDSDKARQNMVQLMGPLWGFQCPDQPRRAQVGEAGFHLGLQGLSLQKPWSKLLISGSCRAGFLRAARLYTRSLG